MELQEKSKFSWVRLLITVGIVIITAGIVGGSIWYYMDQNAKKVKESNDSEILSLQKQVNDLNETQTTTSTTPTISTAVSTSNFTNKQIYDEVSGQLNLPNDRIIYFRIYGQDKISYSVRNQSPDVGGSGPYFAYKVSGKWNLVPGGGSSSPTQCSQVTSVPEQFRPMCYDSGTLKYADANRSSVNYPTSQMVSYIGQ